MHKIIVAGAGKIGSLISTIFLDSGDYQITLLDTNFSGHDVCRLQETALLRKVVIDVTDETSLDAFLRNHSHDAIVSSLPFYCNPVVARCAKKFNLHYFDLTEDIEVTSQIKKIAEGASTAFIPQCGLAPGFIGIAAHHLMKKFSTIDTVKMRVGALPVHSNNALQYALTWSTDGLINEYGNVSVAIVNGELMRVRPLEGLEAVQLDGVQYEAFNTSGGVGSLAELYQGKVRMMNYRTLRYPGHCEKMRFLMNDLRLNEDRGALKTILERAIPKTYQDVVLIYVSVSGYMKSGLLEESLFYKIYPKDIAGHRWSAIQVTTAASLCTMVDLTVQGKSKKQGFVYQEKTRLEDFLANRFGRYYIQG
ncbi:MAG: lysDH [Gammaproteobacteria bacterium]|jgi:saccharopine dehydrogenase-like NADP-dependent oxidoreductase|nr:lysDH [Gammaproteobacteria bacterium]